MGCGGRLSPSWRKRAPSRFPSQTRTMPRQKREEGKAEREGSVEERRRKQRVVGRG
jgi:hypothetical protein